MVTGLSWWELFSKIGEYPTVFDALYPYKELNLTEISEEASVSKSTVSRLLGKVVENKVFHIRLEERTRGRPAKYLKLTEEVRALMASGLAATKPKTKHDDKTIRLLIRTLKDDNLPQNIKESAAYRLRDCCSWEGEIEGGKCKLRDFFIDTLEGLEDNEEKELTKTQIKIALEYYIASQLKDEEDILWMKMTCFPKLISIFNESKNIKERKRVLKILSRTYAVKTLYKKHSELTQLLKNKFIDPNEDDSVAGACWEIIWSQADDEDREALIDELFKMTESEEERIKERGLEHIKKIISL